MSSYLAASGDVGGLIIGIGDIDLAGEKHLSVAVRASMAAGWTGVRLRCYQWREEAAAAAADEEKMDCVSLRFLSCLSPFPLCGKINRAGFQRNRAYETSTTAASSGGFFGWLASFLPSS